MQISSLAKNKKLSPNCNKLNIGYSGTSTDDRPEEFGWVFSNDDKYIIKWFEGAAAARVLDVYFRQYPKIQDLQYKMLVHFCSKLK